MKVIFLIDESGSMYPYINSVKKTFGEYLEKTAENVDSYSVYTFDTRVKAHMNKGGKPQIDNYQPGGTTALYDAVAEVIDLHSNLEKDVQLIIHTDGADNSSEEFTKAAMEALLEEKEEQGWMVTFLTEGSLAERMYGDINVSMKVSLSNDINRSAAMSAIAASTCLYSKGGKTVGEFKC